MYRFFLKTMVVTIIRFCTSQPCTSQRNSTSIYRLPDYITSLFSVDKDSQLLLQCADSAATAQGKSSLVHIVTCYNHSYHCTTLPTVALYSICIRAMSTHRQRPSADSISSFHQV